MSEVIYQGDPKTDGGFNLKEIIILIQSYIKQLWKHKHWIILCAALGGGINYYIASLVPMKFQANLTFSLNEGEGTNVSGIAGILGQYGLGGGGTGKVSMDKIVELSKSVRIVRQALFEKVEINSKNDFIANHLLEQYDWEEKWAKYNPEYKGFRFKKDSFEIFNIVENSALKGIYGYIVGGLKPGLVICGYNQESTIFNLNSTTENEQISLELTNSIFNHLSSFYIQQANEKQQRTYDLVKEKVDSIYKKWIAIEYGTDAVGALWSQNDRTQRFIQTKKSNILSVSYAATLGNLEMADYALKNNTPFIREIDLPFYPLDAMAPDLIMKFIVGLILGGILISVIILGNFFIKNNLKF